MFVIIYKYIYIINKYIYICSAIFYKCCFMSSMAVAKISGLVSQGYQIVNNIKCQRKK